MRTNRMDATSLFPQGGLSNPTPKLFSPVAMRLPDQEQDAVVTEIFDLIRDIKDPEHPHTLEELNVVNEDCITVHHQPRHTCNTLVSESTTKDSDRHCASSRGSESDPTPRNGDGKEEDEEDEEELWIQITFTPTVPHCSLATLIGLCLRVKLERRLETNFKLDITVSEGTHAIEGDVNKQINDKERVAAAMENPSLKEMVEECIRDVEY